MLFDNLKLFRDIAQNKSVSRGASLNEIRQSAARQYSQETERRLGVTLLDRTFLAVNVLHDRNPVAVKLSDGSIRNGYTLHLLNKRGFQRTVAIDVDGPAGVQIHTVTLDSITPDRPMVTLERDATTEVRVVLTASSENLAASTPVRFRITDLGLGEIAMATDHFVNPQP